MLWFFTRRTSRPITWEPFGSPYRARWSAAPAAMAVQETRAFATAERSRSSSAPGGRPYRAGCGTADTVRENRDRIGLQVDLLEVPVQVRVQRRDAAVAGSMLLLPGGASRTACSDSRSRPSMPARSCSTVRSRRSESSSITPYPGGCAPARLGAARAAAPRYAAARARRHPGCRACPRCISRCRARRTSPSARMSSDLASRTSSASNGGSCWLPSQRE